MNPVYEIGQVVAVCPKIASPWVNIRMWPGYAAHWFLIHSRTACFLKLPDKYQKNYIRADPPDCIHAGELVVLRCIESSGPRCLFERVESLEDDTEDES